VVVMRLEDDDRVAGVDVVDNTDADGNDAGEDNGHRAEASDEDEDGDQAE